MSAFQGGIPNSSNNNSEPDEYNLYLGFMIPIGAILALCIVCLFVISWQLICPKCSEKYCPKMLLDTRRTITGPSPQRRRRNSSERSSDIGHGAPRRRSLTLVRSYSDIPPSYETLISEQPPSYDSILIVEEAPPGDRCSRSSGIRTYVYDPTRRISIEVHDEDTIRVVEELLSRRRSSSLRSHTEPPVYNHMVHVPDIFSTAQATDV